MYALRFRHEDEEAKDEILVMPFPTSGTASLYTGGRVHKESHSPSDEVQKLEGV